MTKPILRSLSCVSATRGGAGKPMGDVENSDGINSNVAVSQKLMLKWFSEMNCFRFEDEGKNRPFIG